MGYKYIHKINYLKWCFLISLFIFFIGFTGAQEQYVPNNLNIIEPNMHKVDNLNLGENTQIDLFTGAAVYDYSFDVPPGTNGLKPEVTLSYNSHNSLNKPNLLGSGWTISRSYIQRETNYTPINTGDDYFTLVLNGVPLKLGYSSLDNRFHTEIESFVYIKNYSGGSNSNGQYWQLKTKEGNSYRFGFYNFSETVSNQQNYVTQWYLDLVNDTYGNSIFYNYTENPYSGDAGATYLDKISYNNDKSREIKFFYESSARPDGIITFDNGNKVSYARRLKEIGIFVNNNLNKKYAFSYSSIDNTIPVTILSNITKFGTDNVSFIPPTKLSYYPLKINWQENNAWKIPGCSSSASFESCFVTPAFVDNGIRFADVNRDGFVDILRASPLTEGWGYAYTKTWISNGTGWNVDSSWSMPSNDCSGSSYFGCFIDSSHNINGVQVADINRDGFADIVRASADNAGSGSAPYSKIWLNNGTGWVVNATWQNPGCTSSANYKTCFVTSSNKDNGVRLVDVNGDGLLDLMRASAGSNAWSYPYTAIYLNNGSGWSSSSGWSLPDCYNSANFESCLVKSNYNDNGVRIIDVNGDGLPDVVRASPNDEGWSYDTAKTWINNGSGWVVDNTWKMPSCIGDFGSQYEACFITPDYKDNGVRLADINGDNLPDILRASSDSPGSSAFSKIWINNGTGWVVNSSWSPPHCIDDNNYESCFVRPAALNNNGVQLEDVNGDGLLDFVRASATQEDSYAKTWVNNGTKTGLLSVATNTLGGNRLFDYQKSVYLNNKGNDSFKDMGFNLWVVSNLTHFNNMSGIHNLTTVILYNYSGGVYNYKSREFRGFSLSEEKINQRVINHTFYQTDSLKGRELRTEISDSGKIYSIVENNWNATNQNGYVIVSLLEKSDKLYDGALSNPKIKNITYKYDSFGNIIFLHEKGDVSYSDERYSIYNYITNNNSWIVDKVSNYTILDDNNLTVRSVIYSYDNLPFGSAPNKGSVTKKEELNNIGNNKIANYSYESFGNLVNETDANGNVVKYLYGLRDSTHTFADRVFNSKNHQFDYYYDMGTGNIIAYIDSNGLSTNYTYDIFGRKIQEIAPYDSLTYPTQEIQYQFDGIAPERIITKQRESNGSANALDRYEFYDGLGRMIQVKSEHINSQQVTRDIYYDKLGNINSQSNPYNIPFYENYSSPNTTVYSTRYEYDPIQRVVKIINPDSTFKNITYDHWNITILDEQGNTKKYLLDAYGRTISVIEYLSGSSYSTTYFYNGANDLVAIRDSLGNYFNYSYDLLGRKIKDVDPDRGTWTYYYDSVGNIITQSDARNKNITFDYDSLNRKISEVADEGNITYVYDIEKNGTLARALMPFMNFSYGYDSRLRKTSENKSIDGLNFVALWFYDSLNRVTSQRLSNGKNITIFYGNNGLISNISEIFYVDYTENNHPRYVNYSNGLSTAYSYNNSNFRIKEIKTGNKQSLNYAYDKLGNVILIIDSVNAVNYSMGYDGLYRLTNANITGSLNASLGFVYDQIGNIRNVTGTYFAEYYYQSAGPHITSKFIYY